MQELLKSKKWSQIFFLATLDYLSNSPNLKRSK